MNLQVGVCVVGIVIVVCLSSFVLNVVYVQSSVMLYGLIDMLIIYLINQCMCGVGLFGGGSVVMMSGVLNVLCWGLCGCEDFGGGMVVVFVFENGFLGIIGKLLQKGVDLFGCQVWIGVSLKMVGMFFFGCQYDLIFDFVMLFGVFGFGWGGNFVVYLYDNDDLNCNLCINNVVKYMSLMVCGLMFGVMVGFLNMVGQFFNNVVWSMGVLYVNGLLKFGVGYLKISCDCNVLNLDGVLSMVDGFVMIMGGNQQIWVLVGWYVFGLYLVGVVWLYLVIDGVMGVFQGGNIVLLKGELLVFDNFLIDGCYFVMCVLSVVVVYMYMMGCFDICMGQMCLKWNQVVVQVDYVLLKCMDVYFEGIYQSVSGGNGNLVFNVIVWILMFLVNSNQVVVVLGLWYKF